MKKRISWLSAFIILLYSLYQFPAIALANGCQPIYGGGQTCTSSISVVKEIYDSTNNTFVHNLGAGDTKFKVNDLVPFRISITITGSATINQITLKDIFPPGITFSAGPGTFNPAENTLTFINNAPLAPGTSMSFGIIGQVSPNINFGNQTMFCISNQVNATTDSNETAQDSSQFCLQKTIVSILPPPPIKATPPTGTNAWILLELVGIGSIGFFLRTINFLTYKK